MCDVAMFGPLKTKYLQLYQEWKTDNPTKLFNEIEFVKLLKRVNDKVIKKDSIINGWRTTGLQPFNFNNSNLDRLPEETTNNSDATHISEISQRIEILGNVSVKNGLDNFDLPFLSTSSQHHINMEENVNSQYQFDELEGRKFSITY
jgi:hypothetical protein